MQSQSIESLETLMLSLAFTASSRAIFRGSELLMAGNLSQMNYETNITPAYDHQ